MTEFILFSFFIWRSSLFIIAHIGSLITPFVPRFPYSELFLTNSSLPSFIWSFANFDGVHYLTIAKSGYVAQFTQVFFPLFPLILGLFSKLQPFINPIVIGMILNGIFFLGAVFFFAELLKFDYKSGQIKWIILFLLSFPTSYFFGSLYTESLFLLLTIASFYYARKGNFIMTGILGGLSSATKLTGIFVLPALWWEWSQNKELRIKNKELRKLKDSKSKLINKILFIIHNSRFLLQSPVTYIVPLGLVLYMLYLQIYYGDFLYFWHAQPVFGAERSGGNIILLPQVFWRYFKILTTVNFGSVAFWIPLLELCSTVFGIVLLIVAHIKKIRISYLIFSWFILLVPTLTVTLSSMPRYILTVFPIYIVLGIIKSRLIKCLLFTVYYLLLTVLTILFTRGHWVS